MLPELLWTAKRTPKPALLTSDAVQVRAPEVGCAPVGRGSVGGAVRGAGSRLVAADGGAGLEQGDGEVPQVARRARLAHDRDGDSLDDRGRRDREAVAGHVLIRTVRAVGDGGRRVLAVARVDVRRARPARRRGTRRPGAARRGRAGDRDGAADVDDRVRACHAAAVDDAEVALGRHVRHERRVVDRQARRRGVLVEAAPGAAVRPVVDAANGDRLRERAAAGQMRGGPRRARRRDRPRDLVVRVDRGAVVRDGASIPGVADRRGREQRRGGRTRRGLEARERVVQPRLGQLVGVHRRLVLVRRVEVARRVDGNRAAERPQDDERQEREKQRDAALVRDRPREQPAKARGAEETAVRASHRRLTPMCVPANGGTAYSIGGAPGTVAPSFG